MDQKTVKKKILVLYSYLMAVNLMLYEAYKIYFCNQQNSHKNIRITYTHTHT